MGVTAEMLRPFLEGWTVKQIIIAKRLFIVDHKILKDLPTKDNRPVCTLARDIIILSKAKQINWLTDLIIGFI